MENIIPRKTSSNHIHQCLTELITEARAKRMWLQSKSFLHPEVLFSPSELEAHNRQGRYLWDRMNWVLADPIVQKQLLAMRLVNANKELESFQERMNNEKY